MKKDTLIEIILATVGGLIAAVGMCMCLIPEWNMLVPGIVIGIIGVIVLLCIIPVYRKEHPTQSKGINGGLVGTVLIGIIGALIMGFGMSKIMVGEPAQFDMIIGMITGVVGLLICVLNYPAGAYLKNNKN